ncbi:DNA ligase [Hortaea werneckii]|uniref:DNA ligase n=2 Tax=Hortaea werneckii TaxID=91943 RepID=A0A3M7ISX9_HORWE|nr:DNA ligase [Hortaea werneckii]OTA25252.1 DNA ligase 4 [Hortaea werneckii EXF-2000]KAI6922728.1 DNA ligase [Hortaea werneckii]KAI6958278.1 DNA ligase [Hortaea werneckii]KAI6979420.1 DNA ligase [Hortaea werneckii]
MADEDDTTMLDPTDGPADEAIEEEQMMYGHGAMTDQELDEKYPNRPHNHSKTLPFHDLYLTLFNPLSDNKKKPTGPPSSRRKQGPHGPRHSPNEIRKSIIEKFISRWRKEVGNDIYPAFRLIVPEKDRDRAMYGLKEMTLGKILVRVMKIDKNSDDGYNLLHWKLPGVKSGSAMAGDFAGRCHEVISKRPMRTSPGDMTIAEVNELLDRLSIAQKEENQRSIIEEFYKRMNAEELTWLIRMILRQMKVGATEKTFFDIWHPDAENLFNISSSLRRVCWELYDPEVRSEGDERGVKLMQCFQPQLAAFQMRSMEQMVSKMGRTEDDPSFWIEEKLDGERMQLHMIEDESMDGGKRFSFWSRKAKDYTYLYGNSLFDERSSLTRYLTQAFNDGVRNIILDGEMITWNPKEDSVVPFGTLKTAALAEQSNPYQGGNRPLFRIFDCLFLNEVDLTRYTLRKRREALSASVKDVHRRFEIHKFTEAKEASEIEPMLRTVVAESSEGLVLKNPRSEYRLNERNDDWIKVKPEYMTEFGEALDCVVIGGYYGSGNRGGRLSSFLCGLRVDQTQISQGANPQKCYSFFKVGGGFAAQDYAELRHRTEGKWIDYDPARPPTEWFELGGGSRQHERPDVWIKPEDSIVLSVKAASVAPTDQFKMGLTLRFPRFKKLRTDKTWEQALSIHEFVQLKARAEGEKEEKKFKVDDARKKRSTRKRKREMVIQGQEEGQEAEAVYAGPATKVFEGLNFFIMSEALKPLKKSKAEIEALVKANAGNVVASEKDPSTILVADRNLVKVASLIKRDERSIVRPSWLYDCVKQGELDLGRPGLLLPFEPRHLFFTVSSDYGKFDDNVDEFGDSYTRDVEPEELLQLFREMPVRVKKEHDADEVREQLEPHDLGLDSLPGCMFQGVVAYCANDVDENTKRLLGFAGATVFEDLLEERQLTHVIVQQDSGAVRDIRVTVAGWRKKPRVVIEEWVLESWKEKTLLDEERYPSQ